MKSQPDPILAQMRTARLRRGWSLPMASTHIGIGHIVLGSWERGDRDPLISRVRRLVEGYGFEFLVAGGGSEPGPAGGGDQVWVEHAVRYGGNGLILCDDAGEAEAIASHMAGGVPVTRRVRAGVWRERSGERGSS